jgi:hypothetical protein
MSNPVNPINRPEEIVIPSDGRLIVNTRIPEMETAQVNKKNL